MLRPLSIFTSQDFSWLQNGQLNWRSKGSIAFLFGGGFHLFFCVPWFVLNILTTCGNTIHRTSGFEPTIPASERPTYLRLRPRGHWDRLHNFIPHGILAFTTLITTMGTAVTQWLRRCATNRKVAGSIPVCCELRYREDVVESITFRTIVKAV